MALTSLFGTADSKYGNMLYGEWAVSVLTPAAFPVRHITSFIGNVNSQLGNILFGQYQPNYYNGPPTSLYANAGSWWANESYGIKDSTAPAIKFISASSAFVIAESIKPGAILNRAVNNSVVFTELVHEPYVVSNHINFDQTLSLGACTWNRSASSALVFAGSAEPVATLSLTGSNTLTLAGSVVPDATLFRTLTNNFVLVNEAGPGAIIHRTVTTSVVYAQFVSKTTEEHLTSSIDFDSTATYLRVLKCLATNHCTFVGNAFSQTTFNLAVSSQLLIAQFRNVPTGHGTYITLPVAIVSLIPAFGVTPQLDCCNNPLGLSNNVIIQSANGVIVMPRPLLGDTEEQLGSVKINYSINGNSKITVKNSYLTKLQYTWELRRMKALELRQFLMNNDAAILTMTNWKGEVWYCNIVNSPINLIAKSRWAETNACGGNEAIQVTLDFEGVKIGG